MAYKHAFSKIKVSGQTDVDADTHTDELTLVGSGVTITTSGDSITFTSSGGGGGGDVVDDTTPQLGGDLDVNGKEIVSASNGDIGVTPNGSGDVILDGQKWPQADGSAAQFLTTDGSTQLSWSALRSSASVTLTHDNACYDLGTDPYTAKLTSLTGLTIPANAIVTDITLECTEIFALNSGNPSGNAQIKIDGEWYDPKYLYESYGYISSSDYFVKNELHFAHKPALQTIGGASVNPSINIKSVTNDNANSAYLTDGTLVLTIYWR